MVVVMYADIGVCECVRVCIYSQVYVCLHMYADDYASVLVYY